MTVNELVNKYTSTKKANGGGINRMKFLIINADKQEQKREIDGKDLTYLLEINKSIVEVINWGKDQWRIALFIKEKDYKKWFGAVKYD